MRPSRPGKLDVQKAKEMRALRRLGKLWEVANRGRVRIEQDLILRN